MGQRGYCYFAKLTDLSTKSDMTFGDFDGYGTSFVGFLEGCLRNANMDDGEHSAVVNFLKRDNNSGSAVESLRIGAGHGESGIIAAIEDTAGKVLFQQTEDHTSRVQCFALLRADRAATTGFLVLHGNSRRTMRGPMLSYVNKALKSVGDGHIRLGLTPYVDSEAMRRAIEEGEIQRVRLIRYARPESRTTIEDQWFPRGQVGVEEFSLSLKGKGKRLLTRLLEAWSHDGHGEAARQIFVFEGLKFEEAKIEVVLPDGSKRTYILNDPDAGRAMSYDLEPLGVPRGVDLGQEPQVSAALRKVLPRD